ncbi:hypothetical protein KY290_005868 [Solanum tuberosum]|uniref:Uncharacterized protein n=1 Tax=Solanum tuberosum TaxID=4113 RepID=A0ABQ7WFD3_SOLTU|nr:hypothetical protein KY289_006371 [Solanum tuberosum]KAH0779441.1 hypothetical protein KY290_005868 [Solanum tuberosum]
MSFFIQVRKRWDARRPEGRELLELSSAPLLTVLKVRLLPASTAEASARFKQLHTTSASSPSGASLIGHASDETNSDKEVFYSPQSPSTSTSTPGNQSIESSPNEQKDKLEFLSENQRKLRVDLFHQVDSISLTLFTFSSSLLVSFQHELGLTSPSRKERRPDFSLCWGPPIAIAISYGSSSSQPQKPVIVDFYPTGFDGCVEKHWEPQFFSSKPFLFPSPRPGIALRCPNPLYYKIEESNIINAVILPIVRLPANTFSDIPPSKLLFSNGSHPLSLSKGMVERLEKVDNPSVKAA